MWHSPEIRAASPGRRLRCATGCLLLAALGALSTSARAEAPTLALLLSGSGGTYAELSYSLRETLESGGPEAPRLGPGVVVSADSDALPDTTGKAAAVVTVGAAAARWAARHVHAKPVLNLLVSRMSPLDIPRDPGTATNTHAIWLDQPPARHFNLARLLLPQAEKVSVLHSTRSTWRTDELEAAARAAGWTLQIQTVDRESQLSSALHDALEGSDALLALPDPLIFNSRTLHGTLLTTYHNRIPLFGFSPAYTRAGALASVYSTPAQIGRQAAEHLLQWARSNESMLPADADPAYYTVSVNKQVARSLGIKSDDAAELERRLRSMEQAAQ